MTRARYTLPIAVAVWAAVAATVFAVTGAHTPADDWKKVTAGYKSALGQKPAIRMNIFAIGRLIK
ncbi:hypothetical protein OIU34_14875 [Pararhizobium sp. BT-229]|uniref:hypothetical protein n=1 Tax=Pararhizobium sp. BT-229 TaxID=2986923 RepID=UPI0021F6FB4D|nr:hypothetical protein [Pararhizobium sp. BT-229]MCV9963190.1 hypothetical protein [Pararhizobium sp. BT-229]